MILEEELTRNVQCVVPGARVVATQLELCPKLKLFLMGADNIRRCFSQKEMAVIFDRPPYWTFCWASGHALSFHILANELQVKGRTILDFGAGSGVVAIAAAMAGAAKVFACDNDHYALEAIAANAELNNVPVRTCVSVEEISDPLDMVIAADLFYDQDNEPYLERFLRWAPEVIVAESYLSTIDIVPYQRIKETTTTTVPDLEEGPDFRRVQIYRATDGSWRHGT